MNLFKKRILWAVFVIFLFIEFAYGMWNAPATVTTCIPEFCDNEWGTTLDYRLMIGGIAVLIGLIPGFLIALIITYSVEKLRN